MKNPIVQKFQKYLLLDKDETLLKEFSQEERQRLRGVISDPNSEKITVEQLYQAYSIDTDDERMTRIAKNVFGTEKDELLKYEIPKEVLNITQERISPEKIDQLQRQLLKGYTESYNNPQIPITLERILFNAKAEIYDFFAFGLSFGSVRVVKHSDEDVYRENLTELYQYLRKQIKLDTLRVVQDIVLKYLRLENSSGLKVNWLKAKIGLWQETRSKI